MKKHNTFGNFTTKEPVRKAGFKSQPAIWHIADSGDEMRITSSEEVSHWGDWVKETWTLPIAEGKTIIATAIENGDLIPATEDTRRYPLR